MSTENKYPIGGYAPGNYFNKCCSCGREFMGDKRAMQCEPCAIRDRESFEALSVEQQLEVVMKNSEIINNFLKDRVEMNVTITLRQIREQPIPQNKFPCFCIPTNVNDHPKAPKYKYEHAGMVNSIVRTSADYFEIIETKPSQQTE